MYASLKRSQLLRWFGVLLLIALSAAALPEAQAQSAPRYFPQTGHYMRGAFRSFWERSGGLATFGFPITEEYVRGSDKRIVQYFERARFELTVRGSQAVIELGRLGAEATGSRLFPQSPPFTSTPARRYFAETGHSLFGAFKTTWEKRGQTAIFGLPISEEINEPLADGRWHTVQYFERARFELWPEGVRLGLLGRQLAPAQLLAPWPAEVAPAGPLNEQGEPRPPAAPPAPTPAPAPGDPSKLGTLIHQGLGLLGRQLAPAQLLAPWPAEVAPAGPLNEQGEPRPPAAPPAPTPAPAPGDPSKLGTLIHQGLGVRGPGVITPLAAPPGLGFTFIAVGFDAGERIGVWLTRPGQGGVEAIDPRVITTDGKGGLRVVFTPAAKTEGIWTITAQGASSKRSVTAPFKLTSDYVAPPGTPRPASRNGAVRPAEGGRSTVFALTGSGFQASELLDLWITSPDGVYLLSNARADSRGRVGYAPGLLVQFGAQNPAGVYGYHYLGTRSGKRVDLYFTFTGK